ncbi:MAG TPA: hypothetical protein EYP57_08425 [Thermodesulfobacteriaceae bacterium]|nr:hypothetical protein [Thermodesulfobacteriaceae bacterium]
METTTPVPGILFSVRNAEPGSNGPTDRVHESGSELKKVTEDFESLFINQMLQVMRKSIPRNGLLSGGIQEDVFTSMFDTEVARHLARGDGMGIGKKLYEELLALQQISREQASDQ